MGGDRAPDVVIEGAIRAARDGSGIEVLLVGPHDLVNERLSSHDIGGLPISVVHAPEVVGMDESPAGAAKAKRRSSIHVGIGIHRDGGADAFVSAGNTGAVMAVALLELGRLEGVSRPALPGVFPTTSEFCIVLDVGANMDCRPEQLVQFAQMGSLYVSNVFNRPNPRVGLLNVGEEPGKGNEAAKGAFELLTRLADVNFVGNIEGRDLMHGAADVVICDGFVGNILLKFGESMTTVLPALIKREFEVLEPSAARAAGAMQQLLGNVLRRFSYEEFGGAPLLGVNGSVLIGHGGSSERAIARMIEAAAEVVRADVRGAIASVLA
jgi:phosphate acyltransferase